MNLKIILLFIILPIHIKGQDSFFIGNTQINNIINESDIPEEIKFHFSTRLSFGFQIPLFFDSLKQKESAALELGAGTLFNSLYYKSSLRDNPQSDININDLFGLFLKIEPIYNLWQNKKKSLSLTVSLNNIFYIFGDYYAETIFLKTDSSEVVLRTENANYKYQYSLEPYLGISYRLKTKNNNSYLFRIKSGYTIHHLPIARMSLSDSNETSSIKFNNFIWIFSVGFKLPSNK
jgi:hypothetical protein